MEVNSIQQDESLAGSRGQMILLLSLRTNVRKVLTLSISPTVNGFASARISPSHMAG